MRCACRLSKFNFSAKINLNCLIVFFIRTGICPNTKLPYFQSWENHIARNQSIIVDLFHGQIRSKVRCLHCNSVSVRFDPFSILSLPLPMENSMYLDVTGTFPNILSFAYYSVNDVKIKIVELECASVLACVCLFHFLGSGNALSLCLNNK